MGEKATKIGATPLITTIINSNSGKNKILNYAFSISFDKDGEYNKEYQFAGVTENYYNPETIYLEKERYNALMKYVESHLSEMEKELLEYIFLEMTYIEIAKKTGRLPKSVDNAIQRIRKKLRLFFIEYDIH